LENASDTSNNSNSVDLPSLKTKIAHHFVTVFSLDLRAVALFRICLGLLIIANLAILAFDLQDFYTNKGIMPLPLWSLATDSWHWSVHAASGMTVFQVLLFSLSAIVAALLTIGYRTKLMSVLTWVLLVSLVNRNHFILQAGDQLLVALSFWAMFLPLHARYSIDAVLHHEYENNPNLASPLARSTAVNTLRSQHQYFSIATVAVTLQVLYLYFFTAILKTDVTWRETMQAAYYALSLEHYVTPFGEWIRQFTGLLKVATGYVISVEFIAPILALSFIWHTTLRLLALALLLSLHIAFLFMLHIGLFPLIDFAALTLLLPAALFNFFEIQIAQRLSRQRKQAIKIYYDQDCGFCLKMTLLFRALFLPREVQIAPAQTVAGIGEILERENSWVVTDHNGNVFLHWHAVVFVMSQAWWARPIAWLMKFPPLMQIGNKLYQRIGNNRTNLGAFTAHLLPYTRLTIKPKWTTQLLAAFFLVAITVTNLATVKPWGIDRPEPLSIAIKSARLDQRWGMFAPKPLVYTAYPVVLGTLRNGNQIDLFNEDIENENTSGQNKDNQRPAHNGYAAFPGYRWRKVFERIDGGTPRIRRAYADYLCRKWNNRSREQQQELATIDILSLRKRTNTQSQPKEVSEYSLWQHWCFPEFAPKK